MKLPTSGKRWMSSISYRMTRERISPIPGMVLRSEGYGTVATEIGDPVPGKDAFDANDDIKLMVFFVESHKGPP